MKWIIRDVLRIVLLFDVLRTLGCPVHSSSRNTCGCSTKSEFSLDSASGRRTAYSVTLLTCTGVASAIIPRFTSEGDRLDQIEFSDNSIEEVQNNAFIRLSRKNVQRISFVSDKIRIVSRDAFSGISDSLRQLTFRNNSLSTLPFLDGLSLDSLHVELNDVPSVISGWTRRTSITKLVLENNNIRTLQMDAFRGVSDSLIDLSLAGNLLTAITPSMFSSLKYLRKLNLDENRIRIVEDNSFAGCHELEELVLSGNNLRAVSPGAFAGLGTTLVSLDLGKNQLLRVEPYIFSNLHSLQRLVLAENRLREVLAGAFQNCSSLRDLRLERNNITRIAARAFSGLEYSLGHLYLQFNQLQTVPANIFENLWGLGELWLHKNAIHNIQEGAFVTCRQLMILSLSGNAINAMTRNTFGGLESSLQRLYIDHNKLTLPGYDIFAGLRRLRVLYLGGNPLTCSCRLTWLTATREMFIISDVMHMNCETRRKKRVYELKRYIRRFCLETTTAAPLEVATTEVSTLETVSCATSSATAASRLEQQFTESNIKTSIDYTTPPNPRKTTQNSRDLTDEFRTTDNLFIPNEVTEATHVSFVTGNENNGKRNTQAISSSDGPTRAASSAISAENNEEVTTMSHVNEQSSSISQTNVPYIRNMTSVLNMNSKRHTTPMTSLFDNPIPPQTTGKQNVFLADDRTTSSADDSVALTVLPSVAESLTQSPTVSSSFTVSSRSVTLNVTPDGSSERDSKVNDIYTDVDEQTAKLQHMQTTETTAAGSTQESVTDAANSVASTIAPAIAKRRTTTAMVSSPLYSIKDRSTISSGFPPIYQGKISTATHVEHLDVNPSVTTLPHNDNTTPFDGLSQRSRRPRPRPGGRGGGKGRGNRRGGRRGRKRFRTTTAGAEEYSTSQMQVFTTEVDYKIPYAGSELSDSDAIQTIGVTSSSRFVTGQKQTEKTTTLVQAISNFEPQTFDNSATPTTGLTTYLSLVNKNKTDNPTGIGDSESQVTGDFVTPSYDYTRADTDLGEHNVTNINVKTADASEKTSIINSGNSLENEKHSNSVTTVTNGRNPEATRLAPVHDRPPGNRGTISCPQLGLILVIYLISANMKRVLV